MGITLPTIGQTAWGQPLNDALEDLQDSGLAANDGAFQSWNYPPFHITSSTATTSGSVRMVRLPRFTQTKTISSVQMYVGAATVTPTAGQCFAGLYRIDGTRMGVSADISAQLATPGLTSWNLTAPVVCAPGDYYAALLINAATPSTTGAPSSISSLSTTNAGLTAATAFVTNGPTAQTALPASITMASRTLHDVATWAGVK